MKANELRIGNWVIDHLNDVSQVSHFSFSAYDAIPHTMPNPIPLTEEWLIKFGFFKQETSDIYYLMLEGVWYYLKRIEGGWSMYILSPVNSKPIQHVHQLQNLYFALTNEELIII